LVSGGGTDSLDETLVMALLLSRDSVAAGQDWRFRGRGPVCLGRGTTRVSAQRLSITDPSQTAVGELDGPLRRSNISVRELMW
jgi:hypothetical protein